MTGEQCQQFAPTCRSSRKLAAVPTASHLFILALSAWGAGALLPRTCLAEEIATLDGKKYEGVRDLKPMRDGIVFILVRLARR
jgi:hypothetical protein